MSDAEREAVAGERSRAVRPRPDLFRRFLEADPGRLHFAAHSHHPWPDVSFDGHQRYWLDSAAGMDRKWDRVFGEVVPAAQRHIARTLNLPGPDSLVFAPSTHDLVLRILSCLDQRPVRVLTTDSEFYSFERQSRRLEEAGAMSCERVALEPFGTFPERFAERVAAGGYDLLYVSQVFFNSGYVLPDLPAIAAAAPADAWAVVDGYHAFWARPVDLSAVADRVFFLSGGYKYAMSGEGVCFLHAPPGWGERPVNTGWFAGFAELEGGFEGVPYAADARRFLGATFDPTGIYRFVAVMDLLEQEGIDPAVVHAHVEALQAAFLRQVAADAPAGLRPDQVIPPAPAERGNFLTFRRPDAQDLHARLLEGNVITDVRGDRLRFGFGIYHGEEEVSQLVDRLRRL